MNNGRVTVKHLNREDHAKIDKAAEWTRNHFPWFIKIIKLFIKD